MEGQIEKFSKNSTEEVIIRSLEYHGIDLIDIRVFVKPVIPGDEMIGTKKGLCLRRELIPILRKALEKVEEEPKKRKDSPKQD